MILLEFLLNLLYPPKCVLCATLLDKNETDLCRQCRTDIEECSLKDWKIPFVRRAIALWQYEGNVRGSILRFKFSGMRNYGAVYGRLLAMRITREYPENFELLTWVPISSRRKMNRGYDQMEVVAASVGKELGISPKRLLKKVIHNPPQSTMQGYAQRKGNVLGVYRAVSTELIQGKRILLLDDILTTGATASECARVLQEAGAKEVYCAAIAAAHHTQQKTER